MEYFIINKNSQHNYDNEVHRTDSHCRGYPTEENRHSLGAFSNAKEAVAYAKKNGFPKADGCAICCPDAHKS